jgi:hypothetical protein
LFDPENAGAPFGKLEKCRAACRAHADDDDVVLVAHHVSPNFARLDPGMPAFAPVCKMTVYEVTP